jgi:anthranilate synthase component 2
MKVLVIDNYDSFTYNLVHYIGELGADVVVRRNDKITVDEVKALDPDAIVISPGPCTPNDAGICLELLQETGKDIPTFGVCLGYQAIGQVYGGTVNRAPTLMHGKLSEIRHTGRGVFHGINGTFHATRYHSLQVDSATMPPVLEVTATADDGVVMGAMHRTYPVHGVQFHPESIASEHGHLILKNFLDMAADWNRKHRAERREAAHA